MTTTQDIEKRLEAIKDNDVFILDYGRTPTGKFGGSLVGYTAPELGAFVVKGVLERVAKDIVPEEVFFGNVVGANCGQNVARQVAIKSGLPFETIATTVNKVCASGLKATTLAAASIKAGDINVAITGGTESMSNAPYYLPQHRWGSKYGAHLESIVDGLHKDGLSNAFDGVSMGFAGDKAGLSEGITRKEVDEFSIETYKRAKNATLKGLFDKEIISIPKKDTQNKYDPNNLLDHDEGIHALKEDKVAKLKPSFDKENGICTPANSSPLSDGASAVLLVSGKYLKGLIRENKIDISSKFVRLVSYADSELEPLDFPKTPAYALQKAIKKSNITIEELSILEVNEAFAVVPLILSKKLNIPLNKINPYGGAIALGHALGSSGSRILITLVSALKSLANNKNDIATPDSGICEIDNDNSISNANKSIYGGACICNGGGGATAVIIELINGF